MDATQVANITPELRQHAVPIADLNIDPANARKHPERNLAAIRASLEKFGQHRPAVVQKKGMVVRVGNGMVEAARALGWTHIAAVVVDEDDLSAVQRSIADNRLSDLSEFDPEILQSLIEPMIELEGFDPDALGFTESELRELEVSVNEIQDEQVPLPPLAPVSKSGDLWTLGRHRLLCGNSAEWSDVERLIDGAEIHLVNTDPPYNVKVEPRSNNAIAAGLSSFSGVSHHQKLDVVRHPGKSKGTTTHMRPKDRPLQNDYTSEEGFDLLLRAWFGNLARALVPGRGFYIWGGYANCANYPSALSESGLYFSQSIIWVKEHPVLTRKDFMGNHEWCFYGWREGAAHEWFGPTNATDVWSVKKLNHTAMVHLTEKPVELAVRAIEYSSREGENVIDLFGGSGSTLAACEQTKRNAFLMEIDPPYCDVIVQRWQNLAKQVATIDGVSFDEVAKARGIVAEMVS